MKDFFDSIYYYTNNFYGENLDNYLYVGIGEGSEQIGGQGYLHIGLIMLILTCVSSVMYYYVFKPVRRQHLIWFIVWAVDAFVNFLFAMWYTTTPLINNEIDNNNRWSYLDCTFFSITNVIWSFAFFIVFALLIKWWSPAKYIPFVKF